MKVFKFGGASLKNAQAIRNMAGIVTSYAQEPLLVVVSAMGKTTNALEDVIKNFLLLVNSILKIESSINTEKVQNIPEWADGIPWNSSFWR